MPEIMNAPTYARWSTHSQILGFFEQTPLFNAINFNLPPETPFMDSYNMGFMPAFQDPNGENSHHVPDRDLGVPLSLGSGVHWRPSRLERGQQLLRQRGVVALRCLPADAQHDRAGLFAPGAVVQPELRQPGKHDRRDQPDRFLERAAPRPGNARPQERHVHDEQRPDHRSNMADVH